MNEKQAPVSADINNSIQELADQALYQLNSKHYKEAIDLYTLLLEKSDNENNKWSQFLAHCYLQRAFSFAARGIYKEALELWENYSQFAQTPYQAYDQYISWQLQTNNQDKIESCLSQLSAEQLDKKYPKLAALLGLLLITEHPEYQHYLPQDSIFIAHCKISQSALQAFHDNQYEILNEILKKLPYRSAFKDFRTIIKAIITFSQDIEQAQLLLSKIPLNSVYSQIASLLQACSHDGSELVNDLHQLNYKQCQIIAKIKGLDKQQLKFIDDLDRQVPPISDKVKFNLAIEYQSLSGTDFTQQFCHALLAFYPAGQRIYNKNFNSVDAFEQNRLMALTSERNNKAYNAENYWRQCIDLLEASDTNNDFKIALILRHIAAQQVESEEQIELIVESLQYDPEDHNSYLQVLHYFSQQLETEEDYTKWLSETLKIFPQNIEVLSQAIKSDTHNKAYQQANLHALKLLKIDPLNAFAKQALFSNHLAHARKLIQRKENNLVEKEIQQAEDLHLGKKHSSQTNLIRGLFNFVARNKKQGLQLFIQSLSQLNSDPVNTQFQGMMEALLTGLPDNAISNELPVAEDHILSTQELTRLIQQIEQYAEQDNESQRLLTKSLDKIKPVLKTSLIEHDYDENLMLSFCQTISKSNQFELLNHASKIALTKWKKPIWVYYQIYSDTNGMPEQCSPLNIIKLQKNHKQAMQIKDQRSMVLIDTFLDRYYMAHQHHSLGFLDHMFNANDKEEEEDDVEDPIEALFNHIPETILNKLNKNLPSITKATSPEQLALDLTVIISHDTDILVAMMEQPDLFTALMVIRAAEMTEIDINVSYDDVLNYFRDFQNKASNSF